MKNQNGITIINLMIIIVFIGICIFGGYYFATTMITNTKKDNFINTAKEYVEGAKKQLMSEDIMPSSGHGAIVPFSELNLGKEYKSPYGNSAFLEDYSYVVIVKTYEAEADYKYYVAEMDEKGNCLNLIDYDEINNYSNKTRKYVENGNTCKIDSILLVGPDFQLPDISLDFTVNYFKYQNN